MTPDRIKISMEFNINGLGLWLTAECGIAPGEDVIEEFSKARSLIIKSFETLTHSDYSSVNGHPMNVSVVDKPGNKVDGLIEAIKSCTTLVALERFVPMIERENVDVLYEAYTIKKKELQNDYARNGKS